MLNPSITNLLEHTSNFGNCILCDYKKNELYQIENSYIDTQNYIADLRRNDLAPIEDINILERNSYINYLFMVYSVIPTIEIAKLIFNTVYDITIIGKFSAAKENYYNNIILLEEYLQICSDILNETFDVVNDYGLLKAELDVDVTITNYINEIRQIEIDNNCSMENNYSLVCSLQYAKGEEFKEFIGNNYLNGDV